MSASKPPDALNTSGNGALSSPMDRGLTMIHSSSLDDHDEPHSTGTIRASTPIVANSEKDSLVLSTPRSAVSAASPPLPVKAPGPAPLKATVPTLDLQQMPTHSSSSQLHVGPLGLAPLPQPHTICRRRPGSNRTSDREKQRRRRKNVAVVIGDFAGVYPDELTLHLGEQIEIISKDTVVSRNIGWWTGRNDKGKIGIFPAACVKTASSVDSTDFVVQQEYPLAIPCNDIEMKEVIGIGGFGKVHRAVYKGENVAVKVAKHTSFNSLKAIQDVITEAEKFAHLAHDNVCALIGVVLVKDVCLIMEYAYGGALSDVLHGSKQAISLPTNVILSWSRQIASGMSYLHHETSPSLIHRDLKSSNILLSDKVDPANLHNNTIKITDFGLAREIEHTTHMSEAGTYPWMAPEVIRASDFSKKSDVWSFAVVLWELLTGERPYGGLNLFVVAYGVGHGSLSLPIPDGCPESLEKLMSACWARNHTERPSFSEILGELNMMEEDEFFSTTSDEVFRSIQSSWKGKIRERFQELKKVEMELKDRQNQLEKWWQMQDSKLKEKQAELQHKEEDLQRKAELLEQKILEIAAETDKETVSTDKERTDRPPRLKRFSLRRLIRWLSGPADIESHAVEAGPAKELRKMKRSSSSRISRPSDLEHRRARLYGVGGAVPPLEQAVPALEKQTSMPHGYYVGHRRRRSDDLPPSRSKSNQLSPALATSRRRSSSPIHTGPLMGPQQLPTAVQRVATETELRSRAMSDSTSMQPPSSSFPATFHLTPQLPMKSLSSSTAKPPSKLPGQGGSLKLARPGPLIFNNKRASLDNSPISPMMTVTSVDGSSVMYDSGRHSMSSEASGHSTGGGDLLKLIQLDSPEEPITAKPFSLLEFDPLAKTTSSHDSVLFDPYGVGKKSLVFSTPPKRQPSPSFFSSQKPPATFDPVPLSPHSNIIRPRPRPAGLMLPPDSSLPISVSAPGSRAESPSTQRHRHTPSPTGSVQSLILLPNTYTSEHVGGMGFASTSLDSEFCARDFHTDSESASVTSSILDLNIDSDGLDVPPPLTPEYVPVYVDYLTDPMIPSLNSGMDTM